MGHLVLFRRQRKNPGSAFTVAIISNLSSSDSSLSAESTNTFESSGDGDGDRDGGSSPGNKVLGMNCKGMKVIVRGGDRD